MLVCAGVSHRCSTSQETRGGAASPREQVKTPTWVRQWRVLRCEVFKERQRIHGLSWQPLNTSSATEPQRVAGTMTLFTFRKSSSRTSIFLPFVQELRRV